VACLNRSSDFAIHFKSYLERRFDSLWKACPASSRTIARLTKSCVVGGKASISSFWHVEQRSSRSGGWESLLNEFARRQIACISVEIYVCILATGKGEG
jgi:hypothetical protein